MPLKPIASFSTQLLRTVLAAYALGVMGNAAFAQSFVNGDFEAGATGWSGCPLEINPANVYGGPNSSLVAEVDGHNDPNSTADDRVLCQTVTGFQVGAAYALEFDATRRQTGPTPASVSVTVRIDDVLEQIVTRTGGWNMAREHFVFIASSTTHSLLITPNFTGSHGMLLDNFAYVLVSPLPVELVHFDALPAGEEVHLEWSTATEQDNAGFTIERSPDLEQWEQLCFIPGAGHSQNMISYMARDTGPLPGLSYYRLKQMDLDGTSTYSDIRPVQRPTRTAMQVWPNPARTELHVRTDGPERMEVFNAMGQNVHVPQDALDHGALLHIAHLPAGRYLVRTAVPHAPAAHFVKE